MKKIDKNKRRLNVDKKSEEGAKLHICLQKSLVPVKNFNLVHVFAIVKEGHYLEEPQTLLRRNLS